MAEHLVFTLAAQIASFGDLAGHERRGSDVWPGRSALIGLLGAALGTRRDDTAGQAALGGLRFAVAAYETGAPLRDYHTVQTVPQSIKRPPTRAAAIAAAVKKGNLNTTITLRDYRCGVLYSVAAWGGELPLADLRDGLQRPHFTLYLGRKSCPLAFPLLPQLVEAENPIAALKNGVLPSWYSAKDVPPSMRFVAMDTVKSIGKNKRHSSHWRHDEPIDRERWHFRAREVFMLHKLDEEGFS